MWGSEDDQLCGDDNSGYRGLTWHILDKCYKEVELRTFFISHQQRVYIYYVLLKEDIQQLLARENIGMEEAKKLFESIDQTYGDADGVVDFHEWFDWHVKDM